MKFSGKITKLEAVLSSPIRYALPLGQMSIPLNPLIGKTLSIQFLEQIICQGCHQPIKQSYQEGYCYPCTRRLARCDLCILKPERCHFHLGTCREPQWGQDHCMISHFIYLAHTSGLKVGLTRASQIPTRWIDQGAVAALPIFQTENRRVAGYLEVALTKYYADKTNWRLMLKQQDRVDLKALRLVLDTQLKKEREAIEQAFGKQSVQLLLPALQQELVYPILSYPPKIQSLSLDKMKKVEGTLIGIKGQYLLFDVGVMNVRKHTGYVVEIHCPAV